ncbi:formyltetrahydrofolate deformylase [Pseudomaricurvus alkylphenolicus]|jgi:formyltetrahydrofolate deformylase|uniref:formyltetrahydrofolate deformylase n=1 Tax=Pseudomaricurvus alkylphenolicus TaxID=1306991 RepID=UPI001423C675|nr:formyltetrahydrofolate deformylase [Pseudomaricurvus alkylphenolicus]NIB42191.1 formyltetrahydrofolate deformylase [Pseudomaricurvus alkylphenolicus]
MNSNIVLRFSCADQPGIVAEVAGFFADLGFNIEESTQFEDRQTGRFFMRTEFCADRTQELSLSDLNQRFAPLGDKYSMTWDIQPQDYKPRVVIAVSQWGHCLNGLLDGWKQGTLPIDIVAVVSNHQVMRDLTEWYGVPFHYLPITKETKPQQEEQILQVMNDCQADLLVLARYMQILSDDMCRRLEGRAINIHHSFLPGFKGAKPYHQAHDRGVKLIGASAHYVTADLDEGPLIEQDVQRVSHANSPQELVEIGRDTENLVLRRAVKWHAEQRVLLNGDKTVVFKR